MGQRHDSGPDELRVAERPKRRRARGLCNGMTPDRRAAHQRADQRQREILEKAKAEGRLTPEMLAEAQARGWLPRDD